MVGKVRGFTLLEVVIAVSIFAISTSIVYALFASMMSIVQKVEERTGLNERVQTAFVRMHRDLGGIYRGERGYFESRDSGDPSEDEPLLELLSVAHLSFDPDADPVPLSVIRYYLVPEEQEDTFSLLRSDTPAAAAGGGEAGEARKFTLCEGLGEVRIQYMDRDGNDDSEWHTRDLPEQEQKDDSRFPSWVAIELVFPSGPDSEAEVTSYSTAVRLRPGRIVFGE